MRPIHRSRIVPVTLCACAVFCLEMAARVDTRLVCRRRREILHQPDTLRGEPPLLTFTVVALGGFRGIIADVLWLRASHLQDAGRYIELAQLADWIAKLQPRCTEIWSYQAWNLAYNISVMMPVRTDKWRWVRNGIRLLRDEGIRYNASDPKLYAELGWLFQHKIGSETDRDHGFYRARWATEMMELLGAFHPSYESLTQDPARLARMKKEYGLDPDIMREIDTRFGRLDWRLPETHAVYWAYRGRLQARPGYSIECDRMIFSALTSLVFHGRLHFEPDRKLYRTSPAPELIPAAVASFEFALRNHEYKYIREAYAIFLRRIVRLLFTLKREPEARQMFEEWRTRFPSPENEAGFEAFVAEGGES